MLQEHGFDSRGEAYLLHPTFLNPAVQQLFFDDLTTVKPLSPVETFAFVEDFLGRGIISDFVINQAEQADPIADLIRQEVQHGNTIYDLVQLYWDTQMQSENRNQYVLLKNNPSYFTQYSDTVRNEPKHRIAIQTSIDQYRKQNHALPCGWYGFGGEPGHQMMIRFVHDATRDRYQVWIMNTGAGVQRHLNPRPNGNGRLPCILYNPDASPDQYYEFMVGMHPCFQNFSAPFVNSEKEAYENQVQPFFPESVGMHTSLPNPLYTKHSTSRSTTNIYITVHKSAAPAKSCPGCSTVN